MEGKICIQFTPDLKVASFRHNFIKSLEPHGEKVYLKSEKEIIKSKIRRLYSITPLGNKVLSRAKSKVRELFGELFENKGWPHIDWKKLWKEMRSARIRPMRITYDKKFKKKFMSDQFEVAQANEFEYGRKVVEILSDFLSPDIEILEIGPGPGTLTIPISKRVKSITAIEFF